MQARYCLIMGDNPEDWREVDVETMQGFLIDNSTERGELFLPNFGIKIVYDARTGNIELRNLEENKWIENSYSSKMFESSVMPVKQAIGQAAHWYVIEGLHNLGDPGVCALIQKNHTANAAGKLMRHSDMLEIHNTLVDIVGFVKPKAVSAYYFVGSIFSNDNEKQQPRTRIQQAIYEAFRQFEIYTRGIDVITSIEIADNIIKIAQDRNAPQYRQL